jgi:hypothetical protein
VVSPPAAPPRHDLLYGYFGISGNQIAETADHVNFIHTPDWGDWTTPQSRAAITNRTISQLQEANARGIKQAVVGIGYLVFDSRFTYRGTEELRGFKEQLDALGLSQMVIGIYPVDEPDLHGLSSDTLCALVQDGRSIFPDAKWWVIYSDHGTPGIGCYDYVGTDNYGRAAGVLNLLPALSQSQRWILVPGGTDPSETRLDRSGIELIATPELAQSCRSCGSTISPTNPTKESVPTDSPLSTTNRPRDWQVMDRHIGTAQK